MTHTIKCIGVGLFWWFLYGILCISWIWMSVSFPRLGKFSAIIQINYLFLSVSSSGIPIMQMLVCFILFHKFLICLHSFAFFFSFWCADCVSSTAFCSNSLILSSASFFYCWAPLLYFISVTVFLSCVTFVWHLGIFSIFV